MKRDDTTDSGSVTRETSVSDGLSGDEGVTDRVRDHVLSGMTPTSYLPLSLPLLFPLFFLPLLSLTLPPLFFFLPHFLFLLFSVPLFSFSSVHQTKSTKMYSGAYFVLSSDTTTTVTNNNKMIT